MLIKVIHIGKYYSPFKGGIENFTKELVESSSYGNSSKPFLLVHHECAGEGSVNQSINTVPVRKVAALGNLLYSPISPSFVVELKKVIKLENPELIHVHLPNLSAFFLLFVHSAKKLPWIIHWHSDVLGVKPDWRIKCLYPVYRLWEKVLLRKAKKIIVTSPHYLKFSRALKPYRNKCEVIPLGLSDTPKPLVTHTDETEPAQLPLKLMIVGRLTYYKGHSLLIEALKKCPNVELDIIGVGELEERLRKLVQVNNLSSRVIFHGRVSDTLLQQMYQTCDLVCLPSIEKTEAFGLVLLEAARLAKPALVTDVEGSGMSWVVDDKKTGLVVSANSVKAISDALTFAARNKALLVNYGLAARRKFESEFQIDRIADKITALYKQVILDN